MDGFTVLVLPFLQKAQVDRSRFFIRNFNARVFHIDSTDRRHDSYPPGGGVQEYPDGMDRAVQRITFRRVEFLQIIISNRNIRECHSAVCVGFRDISPGRTVFQIFHQRLGAFLILIDSENRSLQLYIRIVFVNLVEVDMAILGHIELDFAVGIAAAALDVEHLHGMGISVIQIRESAGEGGIIHLCRFYRAFRRAFDLDRSVLEVDCTGSRLVYTADVHGQFAVDEYPQVIVAGEFKYDRIALGIDHRLGILRQAEIYAHRHAEVMVQILVPVYIQIILIIPRMEREETDRLILDRTILTAALLLIGAVVYRKIAAVPLVYVIICVVYVAVVDVVISFFLEQMIDVCIRPFVRAVRWCKQVIQRSVIRPQNRITIPIRIGIYDIRNHGIVILVMTAMITADTASPELQFVILIDAVVLIQEDLADRVIAMVIVVEIAVQRAVQVIVEQIQRKPDARVVNGIDRCRRSRPGSGRQNRDYFIFARVIFVIDPECSRVNRGNGFQIIRIVVLCLCNNRSDIADPHVSLMPHVDFIAHINRIREIV